MLEILLADDEPTIRLSVGDALRQAGFNVTTARDGAETLRLLEERRFDVVLSDIRMPKADGMTVFRRVREKSPETDVILFTGYGEIADAVRAMKEGARDYLTKPIDTDEIVVRVTQLAERHALRRELDEARRALARTHGDQRIIGRAPSMIRLLDRVSTLSGSDAPVLITGESGTGKELVARSLHDQSERRDGPFVAVNCAAFPESLLEAELFGHERGAFTGAIRAREGRFKAAHRGTLFLDEIAEIPMMAQAKLLRVLQEGTIEPLGTNTAIQVEVRVISATHRNLKSRISEARFREDLYYRLKVLDISIPPLRDRRADLPLLVEHFLNKFARCSDEVQELTPRAWAALSEYPFPGNVRELEHAIEHAVVLSRGEEIDLEHLPEDIAGVDASGEGESQGFRPLSDAVKSFEREYLVRALRLAGGKKMRAAEMLKISRKNLWEKLRAHNLQDADLEDQTVTTP